MKNQLKFGQQSDSSTDKFRIVNQNSGLPDGARSTVKEFGDDQLMSGVVRREAAALEALYDRYAAVVMGVALRITSDRAAAEDIVQETFLRVWRNAATYDRQRGVFLGWLIRIARNLAIDLHRQAAGRDSKRSQPETLDAVDEPPDPDADVVENAWLSFKSQQVRAALITLPAAQRQVIELAYYKGMTRQEIAEATGEALGTVHTRARLGLQKLREELISRNVEI
jgi:RNA polymerase sigma-70 factor (ECF subfamily)